MISDKGFEIQNQIRENSKDYSDTILDLQNWEQEIKMKEKQYKSEQNAKNEELTEIRTKYKSPTNSKQEIMAHVPSNNTEEKRNEENEETNKKLADEEKEKGNTFVKDKNFDKALEHYIAAIRIYNKDAAYFSNRALCYLKLEKFTESVADCSKAISLDTDPTSAIHLKSLYRRMLAYESLQKYDKALQDCKRLKKLEPSKNIYQTYWHKLVGLVDENRFNLNKLETTDFIMKPPNQRSKKPLRRISITEIETDVNMGASASGQTTTAQICENEKIPDDVLDTLFNNATGAGSTGHYGIYGRNYKKRSMEEMKKPGPSPKVKEKSTAIKVSSVTEATITSTTSASNIDPNNIDCSKIKIPQVPKSGSQFEVAWRDLSIQQKYLYLKELGTVKNLRKIFESSLTSEILSELLFIMKEYFTKQGLEVYYYLKEISCCSEINILAMMMSPEDKSNLNDLFSYIKEQNKYANEISVVKKSFIG